MWTGNARVTAAVLAVLLAGVSVCSAKVIYVDVSATGANDGSSWTDAYNYLQDALMFASAGDEIRVAQGVYKPDQFVLSDRPCRGRDETFQLKTGVTLKGGYAGFGEPDPNARDIEKYETILSGDLDDNDVDVNEPYDLLDEPTRAENSRHVVTSGATDETAILDGFTITGGKADGLHPEGAGAGMYNCQSNPTVVNCKFSGNAAKWGGGMYNWWASPRLRNCIFRENSAGNGGGMMNDGESPVLITCIFIRNSAASGGGMSGGGALTNCTFSANFGGGRGGGIWGDDDSGSLILTNCILWGNDTPQIEVYYQPLINYSCIQGWTDGLGGIGNIDADPCFADGDYHLKSQAGRWNASERRWTIDEVTSPCIDAGDPLGPIGLEPFPNGGIVNMGAYGGTAEASKSYFNKPPCELIFAGDINGDCEIDFRDFFFVALHWLENYNQ